MFKKSKEKKQKDPNHKHSVKHAKENIKDLEKKTSTKYQKFRSFLRETYNKRIMYLYIACALGVTFIIEVLARGSLIKGFYFVIASPYIFIVNTLIVLMTLSFTLLLRRRFAGIALISLIWLIFGISNCILVANRVTPFTAVDLRLIDSAVDVLDKYFAIYQVILIGIALVAAIIGIVFLFIKAPRINHRVQFGRNIIAIVIIWVVGFGSIHLGISSGLIPKQFGNLRDSYYSYGFVYCFSNSLVNTGVQEPDGGYSEEAIRALINGEEYKPKVKKKDKPNIIFLQLESFFDLNKVKKIKMSQNPIPTFTKLKEKFPSGYLRVPVVGAGTVNTEFEVMTGMNMDDLGPGEYPFKTILNNKTCESIAFNVKPHGYAAQAIHNNTATFYGRNKVFANLGYDTFTTIENMDEVEETEMEWAKDKCLTQYIMESLKSTKNRDYIYTISVQGHGSYPSDSVSNTIKVDGLDDEELKGQYEYYATQTNEMDAFINDLTKKLDKFKEKTILVMYGDHLPSLGITNEDLVNKDVYQTEYVIWSNYKTKYTNEDIRAYELEPKILEQLGIKDGKINSYSQAHRNDKDQKKYLAGLNELEYDQLGSKGKNYSSDGKNPYKPTNIKFGLHEVSITSVNPMNNDVGTVYIYGNSFTPYSKVYVNDEKMDTIYLDRNTLIINDLEFKPGDKIVVKQQNSDTHILSTTKPYVYAPEETMSRKVVETKKNHKKKHKKK